MECVEVLPLVNKAVLLHNRIPNASPATIEREQSLQLRSPSRPPQQLVGQPSAIVQARCFAALGSVVDCVESTELDNIRHCSQGYGPISSDSLCLGDPGRNQDNGTSSPFGFHDKAGSGLLPGGVEPQAESIDGCHVGSAARNRNRRRDGACPICREGDRQFVTSNHPLARPRMGWCPGGLSRSPCVVGLLCSSKLARSPVSIRSDPLRSRRKRQGQRQF